MSWDIQETYALFTPSTADIAVLQEELEQQFSAWQEKHLIIDLMGQTMPVADLESFEEAVEEHRDRKKSFVLVHDQYTYEDLLETLPVVPTVQEAHDLIEMEEIERDLGF